MEYFIYQNELGQKIELSLFSPYIFQNITESLSNDIVSTKQAGQDGERAESWTMGKRVITIQGSIVVKIFCTASGVSETTEQAVGELAGPT